MTHAAPRPAVVGPARRPSEDLQRAACCLGRFSEAAPEIAASSQQPAQYRHQQQATAAARGRRAPLESSSARKRASSVIMNGPPRHVHGMAP
ncbi:hypothetical protein FA09DRAFT_329737 [Tilletiopsis washingtonensis]|uniref:Uncharacterized protein n=1 Tax=Tilletiopsis washingtonensis TaxID=58919 RepID=A0A316ZAQ3_9BASI|nr:hypothetical protein FA09DRAFT_329737 [Tilletiopsis washingtonensis]PWN98104.1 hypothetical protein FA09DRAFT_329737 [Tilletiopsis washingtonensis]